MHLTSDWSSNRNISQYTKHCEQ